MNDVVSVILFISVAALQNLCQFSANRLKAPLLNHVLHGGRRKPQWSRPAHKEREHIFNHFDFNRVPNASYCSSASVCNRSFTSKRT